MTEDTIAAIASPPGHGAIAVLRVSGPDAFSIFEKIFRGRQSIRGITPRLQTLGRIVDETDRTIDQVLLTRFQGPRSYTGEDVVEISCHGGLLVSRSLLERILECGARAAEGGEFTQRAFLNGKMDLTQAEAVMDVIEAQTRLALRAANEQLGGRLGQKVEALRLQLVDVIAHVEAWIDFPEEDIDPDTTDTLKTRIDEIRAEANSLAATAEQGRILREGVRTVIFGAPNAGKSSLLNLLLGFERAIVSETAGTTRDTIEEVLNLRGIPIRLIDTAGFRASGDTIEQEGIRRTTDQLEQAELILHLVDSHAPAPATFDFPESARVLRILNKSDLPTHTDWSEEEGVRISCLEESGTEELLDQIVETVQGPDFVWSDQSVAVNARHRACLIRAEEFLATSLQRLEFEESPEFLAIELRSALQSIGEIVGQTDIEEILGSIFAQFCIGK